MTGAAEIVIEKIGTCVWYKRSHLKSSRLLIDS